MKNIYFACSIRSGRDDAAVYAKLVNHIKTKATVLSEIFADGNLTTKGSPGKSTDIYKKDLDWLQRSDAMIAEVTNPSLGVGYEIAKAEEWQKPILALFRENNARKLSAIIDGTPHFRPYYYKKIEEALLAIDKFINRLD